MFILNSKKAKIINDLTKPKKSDSKFYDENKLTKIEEKSLILYHLQINTNRISLSKFEEIPLKKKTKSQVENF